MLKNHRGIIASTLDKVLSPIVQFAVSVFLARMISPEIFGLFAMVQIIILLANVFSDGGLSVALVRLDTCRDIHFSTTFFYNLAAATLFAAGGWFISGSVTIFYGRPELLTITKILSLGVIASSFSCVPWAILTRKKKFGSIALSSITSIAMGGILAISLAWQGRAVAALLVFNIVPSVIKAVILWSCAKWRLRAQFSFKVLSEEFSFSAYLLGMGVFHVLFGNLYSVIIGKAFNADSLAFFTRGRSLPMMTGGNIAEGFSQYFFSHYSGIKEDLIRLRKEYIDSLRVLVLLLAPVLAGLAAVGSELVPWIFTDKWSPCVPYLSILCLAVFFEGIGTLSSKVLLALGNSRFFFTLSTILSPLEICLSVAAVFLTHSLIVLCWLKVLTNAMHCCAVFVRAVNIVDAPLTSVAVDLLKKTVPAGVMAAAIVIAQVSFSFTERYQNVLFQISLGMIIYSAIVFVTYRKMVGAAIRNIRVR